jgi:hypothetical protein
MSSTCRDGGRRPPAPSATWRDVRRARLPRGVDIRLGDGGGPCGATLRRETACRGETENVAGCSGRVGTRCTAQPQPRQTGDSQREQDAAHAHSHTVKSQSHTHTHNQTVRAVESTRESQFLFTPTQPVAVRRAAKLATDPPLARRRARPISPQCSLTRRAARAPIQVPAPTSTPPRPLHPRLFLASGKVQRSAAESHIGLGTLLEPPVGSGAWSDPLVLAVVRPSCTCCGQTLLYLLGSSPRAVYIASTCSP